MGHCRNVFVAEVSALWLACSVSLCDSLSHVISRKEASPYAQHCSTMLLYFQSCELNKFLFFINYPVYGVQH
jgi:hypothetical protein